MWIHVSYLCGPHRFKWLIHAYFKTTTTKKSHGLYSIQRLWKTTISQEMDCRQEGSWSELYTKTSEDDDEPGDETASLIFSR